MYSNWKLILFFLFVFLFLPSNIYASVVISEVSPSTDPEWIKLFNNGDSDIDLTGYLLKDGNSLTSDDLTLYGVITSKSYVTFNHEKGWLNDGGDTIKLYDNATPSSSLIYEYIYPTSSPIPTQVPTAVPSASPVITSKPTSVPTAKPTVKPTPIATQVATDTPEPESTPVADLETEPEPTPTLETKVLGDSTSKKRLPIASYAFILIGLGFLGYVGYMLYNNNVNRHA